MAKELKCIHVVIGDKPSSLNEKFYYGGDYVYGHPHFVDKTTALQHAIEWFWKLMGPDQNPWPYISGWQDYGEETRTRTEKKQGYKTPSRVIPMPFMSIQASRQIRA